ncbi:MAG: ribosome biogenesis GTP-binding protein YihA/YsxC [Enhydrobacter sp.]|nr:MAG: ribosome biogenesis GTP-binding protein YihA/YsxC [Enhydrobacter sp.]
MGDAADEKRTPEEIEAARKLFAGPCEFVSGAASVASLPGESLPEVAFAGRSNVGKSSLVNALTGRRTLARVSSKPGHTRQINFFDLASRLMLVDLPGYGFAQVSRSMKETWQDLASAYLRGRTTLKRVCLLVDARHGVKEADRETMKNLDAAAVSYQLVLTKADQLRQADIPRAIAAAEAVARKHGAAHPRALATSSETGFGIPELRAEIVTLAKALLVAVVVGAGLTLPPRDAGASEPLPPSKPAVVFPLADKPLPAPSGSERGPEPQKREPARPPSGQGLMTPPAGRQ